MSGRKKDRLDLLLVERGLAETRNKAQALIMSGTVLVNDVPAEKPGMAVDSNSEIRLKKQPKNYVSRGGDKLCLLYTSPSPRDRTRSRMPSSA